MGSVVTFPGVAVVLDAANPVVGPRPVDYSPLAYRGDGPPVTFVAGDVFLAGFYPYTLSEFDEAGTVEAHFTVEHLSGTATVRLHAGTDPTFDVTDPAYATVPLGDHVLSGDGVTAVTIPGFDLAGFLAYDAETVVRVEVLSGSIEVRQLRLRVWPPGGPVGAWVTMPGFDHEYTTGLRSLITDAPSGGYLGSGFVESTTAAAYDSAAAALVARDKVPLVTSVWTGAQSYTISLAATVGVGLDSLAPTYAGSYTHTRTAQRILVNVDFFAGVAYREAALARPPDVVEDYDVPWVIPSGPAALSGVRVVGTVSNAAGHDGPDSFLTWSVVDADSIVGSPYPTMFGAYAPPGPLDTTLPVTGYGDGIAVLLGFGNDFLSTPDPYDGPPHVGAVDGHVQGPDNFLAAPGGAAYPVLTLPAYQTWDPDASPAEVVQPPLRQVQRDDAGTGFSTARWTGASSRQASSRWIGYL